MGNVLEPMTLVRADKKVVDVIFYNNADIDEVEVLDIKKLKFEGMAAKEITKSHIRDAVFQDKDKLYLKNKRANITAGLSKKHLNKIISTVFTKDLEGKYGYLKKEIISIVGTIFKLAIPILMHPELKKEMLFDTQIIHRLALPIKIGGLAFFVMITVKELKDYKKHQIDEFAIYDLYSEKQDNKKSFGSPSTASVGDNPMTFRSHYRMNTYIIDDLAHFVKTCIKDKY